METDYLAIIMIGPGGSSYARGADREDTIARAVRIAFDDWSRLYDLSGKDVTVHVYDVTGRDQVRWDPTGVFEVGSDEPIAKLEAVTRTFPKKRARRA